MPCSPARGRDGTPLRAGLFRGERVSGIKDGAVKKSGSRRDLNFPAAGVKTWDEARTRVGAMGFDTMSHDLSTWSA